MRLRTKHTYSEGFFELFQDGSYRSAQVIVPLVLQWVEPKRVVDVGCGVGLWLAVVKEHGIEDVLGIDGDYVSRETLRIPEEHFRAIDLEKPIELREKFDLAISMEVAEHIGPQYADTFVNSLTSLSSVVLFSAAIPFQGGTHHLNEQWPDYWVRRFEKRGYVVVDCIRKHVWENSDVEPWYAQNTVLFVRETELPNYPALERERTLSSMQMLSVVHPALWVNAHTGFEQRIVRSMRKTTDIVRSGAGRVKARVLRGMRARDQDSV